MKRITLIILSSIILASCSQELPSCDGSDVKDLLFEILKERNYDNEFNSRKHVEQKVADDILNKMKEDFIINNLKKNTDYIIRTEPYYSGRLYEGVGYIEETYRPNSEFYYALGADGVEKLRNYENSQNYKTEKAHILEGIELKSKQYADSVLSTINYDLNAVRIIDVKEGLKKCSCAAELIRNGEKYYTIEYTAQYTEDNQLYVVIY